MLRLVVRGCGVVVVQLSSKAYRLQLPGESRVYQIHHQAFARDCVGGHLTDDLSLKEHPSGTPRYRRPRVSRLARGHASSREGVYAAPRREAWCPLGHGEVSPEGLAGMPTWLSTRRKQ